MEQFHVAQKVTYVGNPHKGPQNGIVKRMHPKIENMCWVVYNCANDWNNFHEYTGVLTPKSDLRDGWNQPLKEPK